MTLLALQHHLQFSDNTGVQFTLFLSWHSVLLIPSSFFSNRTLASTTLFLGKEASRKRWDPVLEAGFILNPSPFILTRQAFREALAPDHPRLSGCSCATYVTKSPFLPLRKSLFIRAVEHVSSI